MTASLSLRNDRQELDRLVCFVEAFARHHQIQANDQARLLIILEELFTNTVKYGYDAGEMNGRIDVALSCKNGRVTIDFSDDGKPFNPLLQRLPDLSTLMEVQAIGGRGILILRSLVDEASYRREGPRNCLVLARTIASVSGDAF